MFTIPAADIASVAVEEYTAAHARGWNMATGIIGSGRQVGQSSGLLLTLRSGQQVVFKLKLDAAPVMMARARFAPLVAKVQSRTRPPGWYPDPSGEAALRWWNGSAWTAASAPADKQ
jgi:hypothetical protein